jgi:hypothetical protein
MAQVRPLPEAQEMNPHILVGGQTQIGQIDAPAQSMPHQYSPVHHNGVQAPMMMVPMDHGSAHPGYTYPGYDYSGYDYGYDDSGYNHPAYDAGYDHSGYATVPMMQTPTYAVPSHYQPCQRSTRIRAFFLGTTRHGDVAVGCGGTAYVWAVVRDDQVHFVPRDPRAALASSIWDGFNSELPMFNFQRTEFNDIELAPYIAGISEATLRQLCWRLLCTTVAYNNDLFKFN